MGAERPVRVLQSQDESQEEKGAGEAQQVRSAPCLDAVAHSTAAIALPSSSSPSAVVLSAALETAPPGVSLAAEAGPPPDLALAPPSPPNPAPGLTPAPGAVPAPTPGPGEFALADRFDVLESESLSPLQVQE